MAKTTTQKTIVRKKSSQKQTKVLENNLKIEIPKQEPSYVAEVERIFLAQKENRWKIANTTSEERKAKLKKLRSVIESRAEELKAALYKDFKKSPHEVDITEIFPVIQEIKYTCRHLHSWIKPISVSTPITLFGSSSKLIYEPKGQVLIIGPWNYPFQLVIAPLVAAVAAGNVVIIKPPENTPYTSQFIQSLIQEIFSENEVAVILGDKDLSNYLLTKPFDHIFFTGSPAVGSLVMQAAAKNLASVTLELGGKSPLIIDETAVMDYTVTNLVWGKLLNGGQTCVGVDYILVEESRLNELVEKLKLKIQEFYGTSPENWKTNPDFCRIINAKNFYRLKGLIDSAIEMGAKLEQGGYVDEKENYISPTILSQVTLEMPIMQEEIFGPILPILTYKKLEEAIYIIQSKPKPLALYIFSEDNGNIRKILKNTSSGGVVINGVILHLINENLPFGGVNHSGLGSYHGFFGFKAFSHERSVLKLNKLDLLVLRKLMPPYTETTKKIIDLMNRFL